MKVNKPFRWRMNLDVALVQRDQGALRRTHGTATARCGSRESCDPRPSLGGDDGRGCAKDRGIGHVCNLKSSKDKVLVLSLVDICSGKPPWQDQRVIASWLWDFLGHELRKL